MKVAIIAAMEEEVSILKSHIVDCEVNNVLGFDIYSGQIAGCDIVLLQSGIGKVASATSTTLLLNKYGVDLVINTGSAGGVDNRLNIGDVVISTHAIYHDVDLTAFGYQPGQMSGCPHAFKADEQLRTLAQQACRQNDVAFLDSGIASGDAFINSAEKLAAIKHKFPDTVAVEMEAASIAHVCWLFSIPFVIVRAISDNGDHESAVDFNEFLPLAAKQSSLIVESMLQAIAAQ